MDRARSVAKWGAACQNCSQAKSKCIRSRGDQAKCDRCERLFKDCSDQVHRPRKKRASRPSKTAQLEERLNGIVDLLRASESNRRVPAAEQLTEEEIGDVASAFERTACVGPDFDLNIYLQPQSKRSPGTQTSSVASDDLFSDRPLFVPETYNEFAPESCVCRADGSEAPPPSESDDTLLSIYQTHLSPNFPFVIIPSGVTAAELQATRPFLMSAIRMVTSLTSMKSMRGQMYRLMKHLTEYMLMRSERSLDLLQGIIVMLGWYHYHCFMHAQMVNLVHLASSLCSDLGFNRHPQVQERTSILVLRPDEPPPRTNEERRAYLGVWFLRSSIAVCFNRTEPMKYSAYLQQCLREIEQSREYESDGSLLVMVKTQRLIEKIEAVHNREDEAEEMPGIPRAHISAYANAFQMELDKIKNSLTKNMRNNKSLMVYVHSVTLHLYQPPMVDAALLTRLHQDITSLNEHTPSALDIFYRANGAVKEWFEHWLTLPVSSYFYAPTPLCCHLIVAVVQLCRWAKIIMPLKTDGPGPLSRAGGGDDTGYQNPAGQGAAASRSGPAGLFPLGAGLAPPPSFEHGRPLRPQATAMPSPPSAGTSPNSNPGVPKAPKMTGVRIRETSDPRIPVVVAALKEQLVSQPGLSIDFGEIMEQLLVRLDQASREMMTVRGEEGTENIWGLSAAKAIITRAKLERWTEIVAQGTAGRRKDSAMASESAASPMNRESTGSNDETGNGPSSPMADEPAAGPIAGAWGSPHGTNGSGIHFHMGGGPGSGTFGSPGDVPMQKEDCVPGDPSMWHINGLWATEMFGGLDQSFWNTDGMGDWSSAVMNSMNAMHVSNPLAQGFGPPEVGQFGQMSVVQDPKRYPDTNPFEKHP